MGRASFRVGVWGGKVDETDDMKHLRNGFEAEELLMHRARRVLCFRVSERKLPKGDVSENEESRGVNTLKNPKVDLQGKLSGERERGRGGRPDARQSLGYWDDLLAKRGRNA